jgi:acetyl esterase/lipase
MAIWEKLRPMKPRSVCLLLVLALAGSLITSCGASAARSRRPVVLLFHSSGFTIPCDDPCMATAASVARADGFEPRVVDYPLWNVPAAMSAARDAVPADRETFAYGESAGGTLAARLAQTGRVRAAALQSPVANLPFFISSLQPYTPPPYTLGGMLGVPTPSSQRLYSPASHRTRHPIFLTAAASDPLTPSTMSWVNRSRHDQVRGRIVPGDHLDTGGQLYPSRVRLLFHWLACQAQTKACSS